MSHYLKVEERILAGPPDLIPFFWRVLRKSASDPAKEVLEGAKTEFEDIYLQLLTRYQALSLENCPIEMPTIFKRTVFRALPASIYAKWDTYSDYQKSYFEDRYFLYPLEDGRYKTVCELSAAEKFTRFPDGTGNYLENNTDYVIYKGEVFLNENPFTSSKDFESLKSPFTLRTPWGETMEYEEMYLYGYGASLDEIPVSTHYGSLVLDSDQVSYFEDRDDYALFVYSVFRVFYTGGTEESLQYFANILAGSPVIATEGERLKKISRAAYGGELCNKIETNLNTYYIPYYINPSQWMVTGVDLPKDTPVGEFITLNEYATNPNWIHGFTSGDAAYLVDKSSKVFSEITYDLVTVMTHEEIESINVMQKPRFDLMNPKNLGVNEFHTGTYGLWNNIIGPEYLKFVFNDPDTSENTLTHFSFILQEVIPVDILYEVGVIASDEGDLMDDSGEFLLDHEGEALEGTTADTADDLLDEEGETLLDHEGEELEDTE